MQQADKAMPARQVTHHIHGKHVMVAGDICLFIHGRKLELAGGHFVVPGFGGNTQSQQLFFHVLHEAHDTTGNGAKVMVFHFLTLGRRRTQQGTACQHEVGTQGRKVFIHQKILLFRAYHGPHIAGRLVAEQTQNAQRLPGQSRDGAQQRNLAVQGFAGIRIEVCGNVQCGPVRCGNNEHRYRGVPRCVAAGLKG